MSSVVDEQPTLLEKINAKFAGSTDFALAIGIIGILLVLLFPVPTWFLDVLLAFSVTAAVLILMTTLFISKPLELSVFPTLLLVTTMLRLALNIASTRLILADGHTGPAAAGSVIEAFGGFVMQGNVVIGLIVFIILTLINFIVITKGSGRIAEVAARFSLDAMPGKQMAIDADLSAGLVDEETAKERRKELEDESTFYGSMDGANKFVRGDAIAGLLITMINLIGGIIIGVVQRGVSFNKAVTSYSLLTVGDGLVSQIPALVISLAAGLLVSKSGVRGSADKAIFGQLSKHPQALMMAAILSFMMALMPGLPFIPFAFLSLGTGYLGYSLKKSMQAAQFDGVDPKLAKNAPKLQAAGGAKNATSEAGEVEESISATLKMDGIRLELGYDLLPLINYQRGHKLTDQIKALRKQIAVDLGFVLPSVRIQDNIQLEQREYIIKIKEIECAKGEIYPDRLMLMNPTGEEIEIEGVDGKDPAFGIKAKWVDEKYREEAMFKNYTVVDPPTVITTHLTELVKENITDLLSYSEVQKLIDEIGEEHKKLIKDVIPDPVTVSTIQKILQNLLAEQVSIRDLATIIESIDDAVKSTGNIVKITEIVRSRLARQLSFGYASDDGILSVVSLSADWEQEFTEYLVGDGEDKQLAMPPSKLQEFVASIRKNYDNFAAKGEVPVLLTSAAVRPYVRSIIERFRSSINVISQNEVHPRIKIRTLGVI